MPESKCKPVLGFQIDNLLDLLQVQTFVRKYKTNFIAYISGFNGLYWCLGFQGFKLNNEFLMRETLKPKLSSSPFDSRLGNSVTSGMQHEDGLRHWRQFGKANVRFERR